MSEHLEYQLKALRLSGMAGNLTVRFQEARANDLPYPTFLQNLVDDEMSVRQERLLNRRMKQATFPFLRTIDEFDFNFNPSLDRKLIKELATGSFLTRCENSLLIGQPGTGKTHLCVALGIVAIHNGFSVRYRSVFDMAEEIARKPYHDVVRTYVKPHLMIFDELGMKTLPPQATDIFLEVIHRRYQKSSTIIATNRPIEDWGKILGDNAATSAILDRFLDRVHFIKITGRSYRLRGFKSGKPGEKTGQKKPVANESTEE